MKLLRKTSIKSEFKSERVFSILLSMIATEKKNLKDII